MFAELDNYVNMKHNLFDCRAYGDLIQYAT